MSRRALDSVACVLFGLLLGIGLTPRADDKPRLNIEPVRAVTLDLGLGECRYTRAPNGTWRQDEFQNSFRTVDNCGSMGFSFPLATSLTFGLHYVSLGSVALDAIAVTCPKDDCDNTRDNTKDFRRADCLKWNEDNCAYRWVSGGNAKGALASAAYRVFDMGALGFDLRGGLFFHQLKYSAVVENIGCQDMPSCRQLEVTQRTHFAVRPVFGLGAKYAPGWMHGGYVGVTWDRFVGIGDRVKEMTAGFKGDTDRLMLWAGLPL